MSERTVGNTARLLNSLPADFLAQADISANQFENIELEWYLGRDRVFTVAIGDDGRYYLAWVSGPQRGTGAGYLSGNELKVVESVQRWAA